MNYKVESYPDNSGKRLDFELSFKKITQIMALTWATWIDYFIFSKLNKLSISCLYKHIHNKVDKIKIKKERG